MIPERLLFPNNDWENDFPILSGDRIAWLGTRWEGMTLPDPPWAASEIEADDVVALKPLRTAAMGAIVQQATHKPLEEYCAILGCTYDNRSEIVTLINGIIDNVQNPIRYFKGHFRRARPVQINPEADPVFKPGDPAYPNHPAYPSGHSTQAHAISLVLATLAPSQGETLMKFAFSIARNREIAGLHFRSDTLVGLQLATTLVSLMQQSPLFLATLEKAKSRLRSDHEQT